MSDSQIEASQRLLNETLDVLQQYFSSIGATAAEVGGLRGNDFELKIVGGRLLDIGETSLLGVGISTHQIRFMEVQIELATPSAGPRTSYTLEEKLISQSTNLKFLELVEPYIAETQKSGVSPKFTVRFAFKSTLGVDKYIESDMLAKFSQLGYSTVCAVYPPNDRMFDVNRSNEVLVTVLEEGMSPLSLISTLVIDFQDASEESPFAAIEDTLLGRLVFHFRKLHFKGIIHGNPRLKNFGFVQGVDDIIYFDLESVVEMARENFKLDETDYYGGGNFDFAAKNDPELSPLVKAGKLSRLQAAILAGILEDWMQILQSFTDSQLQGIDIEKLLSSIFQIYFTPANSDLDGELFATNSNVSTMQRLIFDNQELLKNRMRQFLTGEKPPVFAD